MRRLLPVVLALGLVAAACGSSDDAAGQTGVSGATGATGETNAAQATGATATTAGTGPTAVTGGDGLEVIDACGLLLASQAEIVFDGQAELVEDPFGEGLLDDSQTGYQSVCYYRPVPDDGRVVFLLVLPDGFADTELEALVEGALFLGGSGFQMWDVDGAIVANKGDVVFMVGVISDLDGGPDRNTGLELANLAAARLPADEPDPANAACQLLTEELVESVFGGDFAFGGDAIDDDSQSGCAFVSPTEGASVELLFVTGTGATSMYEEFEARDADAPIFEPIRDVGDDAYAMVFDFPHLDLYVLAGDAMFRIAIQLHDIEAAPDLDLATELAGELVAAL